MTYNSLGGKPGDAIWDPGKLQFVGRITTKYLEDRRFTANGDVSILNGVIKQSGWVPSNPLEYSRSVDAQQNGYLFKGYTVLLAVSELPVEMWAIKAAELLDGEFQDIADMLKALSEEPEKERWAKLAVLKKFFSAELTKSKEKALPTAAKAQVDSFFDNYVQNMEDLFDHRGEEKDEFYPVVTYWFTALHVVPKHYGISFDWYLYWRRCCGIKSRKTPQLRQYFYSRLLEKLEDLSIPRRFRDFDYAVRLSRRIIPILAWKAEVESALRSARWKIDNPTVWTSENVNNPNDMRGHGLLSIVKRTQAKHGVSFKVALKILNEEEHENILRAKETIEGGTPQRMLDHNFMSRLDDQLVQSKDCRMLAAYQWGNEPSDYPPGFKDVCLHYFLDPVDLCKKEIAK